MSVVKIFIFSILLIPCYLAKLHSSVSANLTLGLTIVFLACANIVFLKFLTCTLYETFGSWLTRPEFWSNFQSSLNYVIIYRRSWFYAVSPPSLYLRALISKRSFALRGVLTSVRSGSSIGTALLI